MTTELINDGKITYKVGDLVMLSGPRMIPCINLWLILKLTGRKSGVDIEVESFDLKNGCQTKFYFPLTLFGRFTFDAYQMYVCRGNVKYVISYPEDGLEKLPGVVSVSTI